MQIPYAIEQGILAMKQGIASADQGMRKELGCGGQTLFVSIFGRMGECIGVGKAGCGVAFGRQGTGRAEAGAMQSDQRTAGMKADRRQLVSVNA